MTTVVNIYKDTYDVYCGRAGKGMDGYFGNPFSKGTREENIANFKDYFYERLVNDFDFKNNISDLKDKRLGCFCKPKACHCDIIAEYLNNKNNEHKKQNI